ncbi:hypothetical protein BGX34_007327 [Mortierella sp. NVP85]|nr:hypothetical protein BGX34_007327 [Mortierella sp. NVP85]
MPFIWQDIILGEQRSNQPQDRIPNIDGAAKYHDHVKSLVIQDGLPCTSSFDLTFPRLECLRLEVSPRQVYINFQGLLERHPFVTSLSLCGINHLVLTPPFLKVVAQLPRLKTLLISLLVVDMTHLDEFWNACRNTESLAMCAVYFRRSEAGATPHEPTNLLSEGTFPRIQTLDLEGISKLSMTQQLQWMKQCPELKALRWLSNRMDPGDGSFTASFMDLLKEAVVAGVWPQLESLSVVAHRYPDMDLAEILHAMKRIYRLNVPYSGFGEKCYGALQPHLECLTGLNLHYCPGMTTAMILEIVQTCSQLTRLTVGRVLAHEMGAPWLPSSDYSEDDKGLERRPWVCLQLRRLEMTFVLDDSHLDLPTKREKEAEIERIRSRVFDQLARLTKLCYLRFGFHRTPSTTLPRSGAGTMQGQQGQTRSQPLRLFENNDDDDDDGHAGEGEEGEKGEKEEKEREDNEELPVPALARASAPINNLRKLGTLLSMRRITFTRENTLVQSLEDQDIYWMIEKWEDLEAVEGYWNKSSDVTKRFLKIFQKHHISAYRDE